MSDIDIFKPLLRKKEVDLGGGVSVTIHEFPATVHEEVTTEMRNTDLEKNELWYAKLAMRYLKGPSYNPSDADAERFLQAQSSATVQKLVAEGLSFSGLSGINDAGKKS